MLLSFRLKPMSLNNKLSIIVSTKYIIVPFLLSKKVFLMDFKMPLYICFLPCLRA